MDRWERIARRLLVLAEYGYSMDHFGSHLDEPYFLEDDWLNAYWGEPLPSYVQDQLAAIDLLADARAPQLPAPAVRHEIVKRGCW